MSTENVTGAGTIKQGACAGCGEILSAGSVVCEFCGRSVQADPRSEPDAPFGPRLCAYIIDSVASWVMMVVCLIGAACVSATLGRMQELPGIAAMLGGCIFIACRDGLHRGSPGKRLLSLEVIDTATGQPCTMGKSIGRNIFMMLPLFPLIEFILVAVRGPRMGDSLAGTRVIRRRSVPTSSAWPLVIVAVVACLFMGIAFIGVLAAIAVPNFQAARLRANVRACYANQATIVGALEMYALDQNKKLPEIVGDVTARPPVGRKLFGELITGKYLMQLPQDPGQGPGTSDHYILTPEGNGISCTFHGARQVAQSSTPRELGR